MVKRTHWRALQLLRVLASGTRRGAWRRLTRQSISRLSIALPWRHGPAEKLPPLLQLVMASWASQTVYVAAKLGVADALRDGPKSCDEIAIATGASPRSLARLLRALCSLGVVAASGEDGFVLRPLGRPLQAHRPGSLRAMVLTLGEIHYEAWSALAESIKTAAPAFPHIFGTRLFDHLDQHRDAGATFHEAMTDLAALISEAVLLAYDFGRIDLLVDVGGGYGQFLTDILTVYPKMRGILVDTPAVIREAHTRLEGHHTRSRCTLFPGNLLEFLPRGGNLYLLSGVIHDWDDDEAVTILKECRRAMAPNGKVLVVENLLSTADAGAFVALLDLNMLVMTGGRERTENEFRQLFDAAGLEMTRMTPTLAPQWAIEGSIR